MFRISRRTFGKHLLAAFVLALLYPARFAHSQLLGVFRNKGHETPAITANDDFYVTSFDLTPAIDRERWSLTIDGMVKHPRSWSFAELRQRPQTTMTATLECIGNTVGGDSIGTAEWKGVKLNHLLNEAEVDPKSFDLVLRGADGYSDSVPASRALEDDVLLAVTMNGVPLPPDHGYPARVIVPGIYGMKNVKWLTGLELVDYDYKGYWQRQSWSDTALVKLSSRIDVPGDRERITTPQYMIKGIAFNGRRTIRAIEVSTDAGITWRPGTLLPARSPQTWTPWSYTWNIPKAGEYTIMAKATNDQGLAQTLMAKKATATALEIHAVTVDVEI